MRRFGKQFMGDTCDTAESVTTRPMMSVLFVVLMLVCAMLLAPSSSKAQDASGERKTRILQQLDQLLAQVKPGQTTVYIDDMGFTVKRLQAYRDQLRSGSRSAFALVTLWTNGVIPYTYAAGLEDAKKTKFEAAIALWEQVADLDFVVRTSETNYIRVQDGGDIMNPRWAWLAVSRT